MLLLLHARRPLLCEVDRFRATLPCPSLAHAGIGGIAFPVAIVLLIPVRSYLLPRLFAAPHLATLDGAEVI